VDLPRGGAIKIKARRHEDEVSAFAHGDSRGEYCWMGEQSGGATSIAFIVSADDPTRVAFLLSRPTGFGSIKPGERFQLFYVTNNLRHASEQATVSANPFFAFSAITADTLKVFLITHKPQPISGADMAWVWFGRRPM
jgi:hypothetical protein